MKKIEFEKKIKEFNLDKIVHEGQLKTYSNKEKSFYKDHKRENLYGCYLDEDGRFIIFFTDAERGIVRELGSFAKEDEAYDALYKILVEWSKENEKTNDK